MLGKNNKEKFELYNRLPFVLITPERQQGILQPTGAHLDIAPSIMQIVDQENYQPVEHFLGTSMFAENYSPQVLNKCLGKVYFTNEQVTFEGSAKSGVYKLTHAQEKLLEVEQEHWLSLIDEFVELSDKTIYSNGLLGE